MAPLIGLLAILCGLWFLLGMPVTTAVFALEYRRTGVLRKRFLVAAVMLVVFYVTAVAIWGFAVKDWNLSFLTTLEATVDSEKYGHPVEHRAELMVIWLLFMSTAAAGAAGALTAAVSRRAR